MKKIYLSWKHIIYLLFIFIFFCIFYIEIHPLCIVDPDDWTYINYIRDAVPIWKSWNPAKIFPETFMGFCGDIAVYMVYPIIHNYSLSMTIVYGIVVSLFISIYIYAFDTLLMSKFNLSSVQTFFVSFIYLTGHFLVFKSQPTDNLYMLKANDLNCYINYLVPFLLCASLSFLYIAFDIDTLFSSSEHYYTKGIWIFSIYLAIFSNMVDSIVFISMILCTSFYKLLKYIRLNKNHFLQSWNWKDWYIYIYIYTLEFICLIFESAGGRASDLKFNLKSQLSETLSDCNSILHLLNRRYLFLVTAILIVSIFVAIKMRTPTYTDKFIKLFVLYLTCFVLCSIYTFCLMTRIGLHKITRSENICIFFVYGAVLFAISISYLIKSYSKLSVLIPLLIYIAFFETISGDGFSNDEATAFSGNGTVYQKSYSGDNNYYSQMKENNYIVKQFIEAHKNNENEVTLHVSNNLNYDFAGTRISTTLYHQHISSRYIKANIIVNDNQ